MPAFMPNPKQQYFGIASIPLIGGKIFTYAAGGSVPKATFTDAAGTITQPNPIVLNARGEPPNAIFWSGSYRVVIQDALGNLIYTVDNYQTPLTPTELSVAGGAGAIGFDDDTVYPAGSLGKWLTDLAKSAGSSLIGFIQAGAGAILRTLQDKGREIPSICDYGAVAGQDCYDAINKTIAAHGTFFVPAGVFLTSAGSAGKPPHNIVDKTIFGLGREISIIKATGVNEGRTLFVNNVTDVNNPGVWGKGRGFSLHDLGIRGNWDKVAGLANVTEDGLTASVGVTKAQHDPATNTALIKVVSAAYVKIKDCYIDDAYEHNLLMYRTGYTEIDGNIFARARGAAAWLTADSAAAAITSTIVEKNQMVACRGGFGALVTKYTYGCAFRDNRPFEDNARGATFGEGADTDISGNYFEANGLGDAVLDPTLWGLTLINNYWTIPPTLPPVGGFATRGYFCYDRKKGLRHIPVGGLGETDNQLGPLRYSCDSQTLGVGNTAPAASGAGLTFPTVQVPSTSTSTLDDYAERGVNMVDASGAGLAITGTCQFTKVGRLISVTGVVTFPATGSGASVAIGGFPMSNDSAHCGTIVDNAGLGASSLHMLPGDTKFYVYPAGTFANRTNANFSGKVMYFTLTYSAAN